MRVHPHSVLTHTHTRTCPVLLSDCPGLPAQVKCEHYWPLDAQPCTHGQLQVTLMSEEVKENWTVRDLQLFHVSPFSPTKNTSRDLPAVCGPETPSAGIEASGVSTLSLLSPHLLSGGRAADSLCAPIPLPGLARSWSSLLPRLFAGFPKGAAGVGGPEHGWGSSHCALQVSAALEVSPLESSVSCPQELRIHHRHAHKRIIKRKIQSLKIN